MFQTKIVQKKHAFHVLCIFFENHVFMGKFGKNKGQPDRQITYGNIIRR